jgi:hypothetical protein
MLLESGAGTPFMAFSSITRTTLRAFIDCFFGREAEVTGAA